MRRLVSQSSASILIISSILFSIFSAIAFFLENQGLIQFSQVSATIVLSIVVLAATLSLFFYRSNFFVKLIHISLAITVIGAALSSITATNLALGITRGSTSYEAFEEGNSSKRIALPFGIELVDFSINYYPDGKSPKEFISQVKIHTTSQKSEEVYTISLNSPLLVEGHKIFQYSWQKIQDIDSPIFLIRHDPLGFLPYIGGVVFGISGLLFGLLQRRISFNLDKKLLWLIPSFMLGIGMALLLSNLYGPSKSTEPLLRKSGAYVALSNYLDKALGTHDISSSFIFDGKVLGDKEFIALDGEFFEDGKSQILSPNDLFDIYTRFFKDGVALDQKLYPLFESAFSLSPSFERISFMDTYVREMQNGSIQKYLENLNPLLFGNLLCVFERGRPETLFDYIVKRKEYLSVEELQKVFSIEFITNQKNYLNTEQIISTNAQFINQFPWAILFLPILALVLLKPRSAIPLYLSLGLLSFISCLQFLTSFLPPWTNLAGSLGFVAMVLIFIFPNKLSNLPRIIIIAFLTLVQLFLGNPITDQIMPVLRTPIWLWIHVGIILIGYSVILIGSIFAHIELFRKLRFHNHNFQDGLPKLRVLLNAGLILVAMGTILGGFWADQSWGRFWAWDPKESGALILALFTSLYLHLIKTNKLTSLGFILSSASLILVILYSWFGVNFLGKGLHSYGFSNTPIILLVFALIIELGFLIFAAKRISKTDKLNLQNDLQGLNEGSFQIIFEMDGYYYIQISTQKTINAQKGDYMILHIPESGGIAKRAYVICDIHDNSIHIFMKPSSDISASRRFLNRKESVYFSIIARKKSLPKEAILTIGSGISFLKAMESNDSLAKFAMANEKLIDLLKIENIELLERKNIAGLISKLESLGSKSLTIIGPPKISAEISFELQKHFGNNFIISIESYGIAASGKGGKITLHTSDGRRFERKINPAQTAFSGIQNIPEFKDLCGKGICGNCICTTKDEFSSEIKLCEYFPDGDIELNKVK